MPLVQHRRRDRGRLGLPQRRRGERERLGLPPHRPDRPRERGRLGLALLAGGVAIAGYVMMRSGGGSASPSASIAGAPLAPPKHKAAADAPPPPPRLDLDKMTLVGDHYEAPLEDGRRAILTLDPDLQQTAEHLLEQARAPRGAIVAMAPDGRVLALAGRRTSDPKGGKDGTPDWHLATQVWAPAASVFKLVTASALVESGYDPDAKICYHGGIRSVTESNLRDDRRDNVCKTLVYGVAHSNNAILAKLAFQHLQPGQLLDAAHVLGLGRALPASLAVPGEFAELSLPTSHDLDFGRAAAGFEGSRLSVLGGALLAATFADAGEQPTPRLIASIVGAPPSPPPAADHRVLPAEVAHAVARMMAQTCASGTARKSFRRRSYAAAGKTGTLATNDPFYMLDSWFVGFAPIDKPQIIVSVLLGNTELWYLRGHDAAGMLIDRAVRHETDHAGKVAKRAAKRVR